MTAWGRAARWAGALVVSAAAGAAAQTLPSQPIAFADGQITIGGDVAATFACTPNTDRACGDDLGFFNYTDYEHSALRMLRIDLSGAAHAGEHFAVLGELRNENFGPILPYALYVRVRPWSSRNFDIQAGRIPPVFGAFARRTYANDNPLIGYPLAYQYLTTVRPDAVPGDADELLQKRSTGWLVRYRYGTPSADAGVPLVSAFRWDTGVQVHGGTDAIQGAIAVTNGTVAHPLFKDDNNGRQVAGRVELRPIAGLIVGSSLARGPFFTDMAVRGTVGDGHDREFTQTAWGADAEYSHGYYLLRLETIVSAWKMPVVRTPALDRPLRAYATSVEGRYKLAPGFYVAGRVDHLGFSTVAGSQGSLPWDAPVTRIEAGIGYSIQRNLIAKVAVQDNRRDGGRLRKHATMAAAQIVFWF